METISISKSDLVSKIETRSSLSKKSYTTLKSKYIKVDWWFISNDVWIDMLKNMINDFNLITK